MLLLPLERSTGLVHPEYALLNCFMLKRLP